MIKNCIYCDRTYQRNHENKCSDGKKIRAQWFKILEEIFDVLEIKYFFEQDDNPEFSFGWKGSDKGMNFSYPFDFILHEFSHWVVSDPDRRKFSNFGFELLDPAQQKSEENKAIVLQKLLENSLFKRF